MYQQPKYPLFVDLSQKRCVVIGAGKVAERKIESLLSYGTYPQVIAPCATPQIEHWAQQNDIKLIKRSFMPGDVKEAFLVICATSNSEINQEVYQEAHKNNCLVNVVDKPELCNFYVPSVVRRGSLQIAISTSGAAPTVAKRIRQNLETSYGSEWEDYLDILGNLRQIVLKQVPGGEEQHKPLFEALAQSNLLMRITQGESITPDQAFQEYLQPLLPTPEESVQL